MNINQNNQNVNFNALYWYNISDIRPNMRKKLDGLILFNKDIRIKKFYNKELLAAPAIENKLIKDIFAREKVSINSKDVSDKEIEISSMKELFEKYILEKKVKKGQELSDSSEIIE